MATNNADNNETTYEAEQASSGTAQRADTQAVRLRSGAPSLLSPDDLDARQSAIGTSRRSGGPSLDEAVPKTTRSSSAAVEPSGTPPTECQEP